jgi:hypothetical protein
MVSVQHAVEAPRVAPAYLSQTQPTTFWVSRIEKSFLRRVFSETHSTVSGLRSIEARASPLREYTQPRDAFSEQSRSFFGIVQRSGAAGPFPDPDRLKRAISARSIQR